MKKLMQKSKNRQELFNNTITHFNGTNRGYRIGKGCSYRNDKGVGCAIGREISDNLAKSLDSRAVTTSTSVSQPVIFNQLPTRLKRMSRDYLTDIQKLHDICGFWDNNGLSPTGLNEAKTIAKKWKLNTFAFGNTPPY